MIFGVVFFFVVIRFYCKKSRELYEVDFKEVKLNYKVVLIGGFIVGVVSGFFGIGGGVINVFFFIYMGFFIYYVVVILSFVIVFMVMFGVIKYYILGNVEVEWFVFFVLGLIIGV